MPDLDSPSCAIVDVTFPCHVGGEDKPVREGVRISFGVSDTHRHRRLTRLLAGDGPVDLHAVFDAGANEVRVALSWNPRSIARLPAPPPQQGSGNRASRNTPGVGHPPRHGTIGDAESAVPTEAHRGSLLQQGVHDYRRSYPSTSRGTEVARPPRASVRALLTTSTTDGVRLDKPDGDP
jgi:hypothetical protein